MPEKPFEAIEGDDPLLRQRFLAVNQQQPPDNFIESGEGGGLDWGERSPEKMLDKQIVAHGLAAQLKRAGAKTIEDDTLLYD